MVEYTEWVSLGHEVYKAKGGTYDGDTAAELVQVLARFWNRNREELISIGQNEARNILENQLQL